MPKQYNEKVLKICQCRDNKKVQICKCRNNVTKKYRRFVSAETMLRKNTEDLSVPRQCSEKVQNICQCRDNVMRQAQNICQCRDNVTKQVQNIFQCRSNVTRRSTEDLSVPR